MGAKQGIAGRGIDKAKVFMNGRSQAVRIPAEYRFSSSEVWIRRDPSNGDIILSESPHSWAEVFSAMDAAGAPDGIALERDLEPVVPRPTFDAFFGGGPIEDAE